MACSYQTNQTTLIIKNLPDCLIEEDLPEIFGDYGLITRSALSIDQATGESMGEAFVQFEDEAAAAEAYKQMDNCMYLGHTLNIRLAHFRWPMRGCTLVVSNLPGFTTVSDIEDLFDSYGPIIRSTLALDQLAWNAGGFGMVEVRNAEIAQRAREDTNGMPLEDAILKVEFAGYYINL